MPLHPPEQKLSPYDPGGNIHLKCINCLCDVSNCFQQADEGTHNLHTLQSLIQTACKPHRLLVSLLFS